MREDFKKLFNHLETVEPPKDLSIRLMLRYQQEQKTKILMRKLHLSLFSLVTVASAVFLVPTIKAFLASVSESGFLYFFSLLFSDFKIMVANWQVFGLSLLESLPVLNLAILLFVIFIFLGSLKFLSKDLKIIFRSNKLTFN